MKTVFDISQIDWGKPQSLKPFPGGDSALWDKVMKTAYPSEQGEARARAQFKALAEEHGFSEERAITSLFRAIRSARDKAWGTR